MTIFAYGLKLTGGLTKEQQEELIQAAGFDIEDKCWFSDEDDNGKLAITERPRFNLMFSKMRKDEQLVVAKLEYLGRSPAEILKTLTELIDRSIEVTIIELNKVNINTPEGTLIMEILRCLSKLSNNPSNTIGKSMSPPLRRPQTASHQKRDALASRIGNIKIV